MTENVVVRLYDISVWCVATSTSPSTAGSKLQVVSSGLVGWVQVVRSTLVGWVQVVSSTLVGWVQVVSSTIVG